MESTVKDIFLLVFLLITINQGNADIHYMCDTEDIQLKEANVVTTIYSQNYPAEIPARESSSRDCFIHVTGAAELKLEVHLEQVSLPTCSAALPEHGSCLYGCDHLYMHEPDLPDFSTHYVFGNSPNIGETFTTTTRRLYIKFCRHFSYTQQMKFALKVTTLEKIEKIDVSSKKDYYFSSPYFPSEYNIWNGYDTYRYRVQVETRVHLLPVLLNFTDWNLHTESEIVIKYNATSITITAAMSRPFHLIPSRDFTVEFHTGKDVTESYATPVHPYHLWRAQISVQASSQSALVSECGHYFYEVSGGHFKVNDDIPCDKDHYLDCIFVVARKQRDNACFDDFILRFTSLRLQSELGDSLEVRKGTTSGGAFLWRHFDELYKAFRDEDSYYIHFRGKCRFGGVRLSAVFASTRNINRGFCEDSFKCGDNAMYIPRDLVCDGVEHCFDGTDESQVLCQGQATHQLCEPQDLVSCNSLWKDKYCIQQKCDGIPQCPDGEDESSCHDTTDRTEVDGGFDYSWGTIIPIVLSCLVVAFIMCVLISLFTRMKRAQRQGVSNRSHRNTPFVDFFGGDDLPPAEDLPPPYDDVVRRDAPFTHAGYVNTAFPLLEPPPYTPSPGQTMSDTQSPPATQQAMNCSPSRRSSGEHPARNRLYRDSMPLQQIQPSNGSMPHSDQNINDQRSSDNPFMLSTQNSSNQRGQNVSSDFTSNRLSEPQERLQNAPSSENVKDDSDASEVKTDHRVVRQLKSGERHKAGKKAKRGNKKTKKTRRNIEGGQNTSDNGDQVDSTGNDVRGASVMRRKPDDGIVQINKTQNSRETTV